MADMQRPAKPYGNSQRGHLFIGIRKALHKKRKNFVAAVVNALWSPADNFSAGQLGAWYDPSTFTGLYQDSAGTSPATAVGQPIGKMLDNSGRGNHISQATASARPLISARVNLLTKTEDFTDAVWNKINSTVANSPNAVYLDLSGVERIPDLVGGTAGKTLTFSVEVSVPSGTSQFRLKNTQGGVIDNFSAALTATTTPTRYSFQVTNGLSVGSGQQIIAIQAVGAAANFILNKAEFDIGNFVKYQRVNTATDYDTVGFPQSLNFDGLDDGMSTGPITLGADMDCFIAVYRANSTSGLVLAYNATGGNYVGYVAAGSGAIATAPAAGTPTYLVNGATVPGGIATNANQLHAAIPAGTWCIVEIRDLNLASWAAFGVGVYDSSSTLNGNIGGLILCPAGDATTRQKNRQWLGNKVGLTLP